MNKDQEMMDSGLAKIRWTNAEELLLLELRDEQKCEWPVICQKLQRPLETCQDKYTCLSKKMEEQVRPTAQKPGPAAQSQFCSNGGSGHGGSRKPEQIEELRGLIMEIKKERGQYAEKGVSLYNKWLFTEKILVVKMRRQFHYRWEEIGHTLRKNPEQCCRLFLKNLQDKSVRDLIAEEKLKGSIEEERPRGSMGGERVRGSIEEERPRGSMGGERARGSMGGERARGSMGEERARGSMGEERPRSLMDEERLRSLMDESERDEGVVVTECPQPIPHQYRWSPEEINKLVWLRRNQGRPWNEIGQQIGRTKDSCIKKYSKLFKRTEDIEYCEDGQLEKERQRQCSAGSETGQVYQQTMGQMRPDDNNYVLTQFLHQSNIICDFPDADWRQCSIVPMSSSWPLFRIIARYSLWQKPSQSIKNCKEN